LAEKQKALTMGRGKFGRRTAGKQDRRSKKKDFKENQGTYCAGVSTREGAGKRRSMKEEPKSEKPKLLAERPGKPSAAASEAQLTKKHRKPEPAGEGSALQLGRGEKVPRVRFVSKESPEPRHKDLFSWNRGWKRETPASLRERGDIFFVNQCAKRN